MKKTTFAALALAGVAFSSSLWAQQPTYAAGDLIMGIRATDTSNSLLINLGPAANFAPLGFTASFTISSADLSATLGADWFTRIDPNTGVQAVRISFVAATGIAGANGDPARTLYTSSPNAAPFNRASSTTQGQADSRIQTMGGRFASGDLTGNTANASIQANSVANSFASYQPGGANSGGISFAYWNPTNEVAPGQTAFLDRLQTGTGAGTVLGSFALDGSGNLSYAAVPEPSTYVIGAVASALMLAFYRRRRLAQVG